ncbi:MAG: MaoC family dehydratase N-terminal domain-containing protein [Burkholderiaceae bacterium]|jgi:acyl dehydratase|nr:MaoC family dehydratase N-terminal domain-containing protein [Burkholderiaceae bacterium]
MKLRDAQQGDRFTLPATTVTRGMLALYAGASGDHHPIHIDLDAAKAAGFDDVFAHGMLSLAFLGRLLTDLAPQPCLRQLDARFISPTPIGAVVVCTAEVTEVARQADGKHIALALQAVDELTGEARITGSAKFIV